MRERSYVESPVRIRTILKQLERSGLVQPLPLRSFPDSHIKAVHDPEYVQYLKRVCTAIGPGESVYPYVFGVRNVGRPPEDLALRAGYYCIDTFTPLNRSAYLAARRGVDGALTAAERILAGQHVVYVLTRPPGSPRGATNFRWILLFKFGGRGR